MAIPDHDLQQRLQELLAVAELPAPLEAEAEPCGKANEEVPAEPVQQAEAGGFRHVNHHEPLSGFSNMGENALS